MKPLTDSDNAVLQKIATDNRRNEWVSYPNTEYVTEAVRHLCRHKMLVRHLPKWQEVKLTPKAWRHLSARRQGKPYRMAMSQNANGQSAMVRCPK